jgi:hypothetical protein
MTSARSRTTADIDAAGAARREGGRTFRADRRTITLLTLTTIAACASLLVSSAVWSTVESSGRLGADFQLYLDATQRTMSGGHLYLDRQLAGPYELRDGDILYPPPIILLMLPFTVLPAALFWIVPLATIAVVVVHHRPALWSWPIVGLAFVYPVTSLKITHGNPTMWIVAAIALATLRAGPGVLVLLKPTLAPFALIGINRRQWWFGLAIGTAICAVFAPLWVDYLAILANARGRGILYSLDEVPFALVPVISWLASPRFHRPRRLRVGRATVPVEAVPARSDGGQ